VVSNAQGYNFRAKYEDAFAYLRKNKNIRDVLLSGGDPLLLNDQKLQWILEQLRSIPHIEFIRIGSRVPVFVPQRITKELCTILAASGPIWMSIHVNHPKECTLELQEVCKKLRHADVVLGNQSVLLKGINDDVKILTSLSHRLLMIGVRPYYLYQCDLVTGSKHFRVDINKGLEIIDKMQGHTTGYAVPKYVIDAPGGGGKIPIQKNYIETMDENKVILKNYQGNTYQYPMQKEGEKFTKKVVILNNI